MNEKKEYVGRDPTMINLAKELSTMSRNAGTVGFTIKYSATKGNIAVHEEFQKYCFDEANNEYLIAIDKLMQNAKFIDYFRGLDERITVLENKEDVPKEDVEEEKEEEDVVKTF